MLDHVLLSDDLLKQVSGFNTTREAWIKLEKYLSIKIKSLYGVAQDQDLD